MPRRPKHCPRGMPTDRLRTAFFAPDRERRKGEASDNVWEAAAAYVGLPMKR